MDVCKNLPSPSAAVSPPLHALPKSSASRGLVRLLERGSQTQAELARQMGKPRSAIQHFLCGRRHPSVETVHSINAAMGKLFQSEHVSAHLESLVADSIDGLEPLDYNVSADADGGFMLGINLIFPYLKDGALDDIMRAWRARGSPAGLFHDVNRAWRREVIRSIDGTVPQKLFIDELTSIFQKYDISLPDWFKPDSEIYQYRALSNVIRVIKLARNEPGHPSRCETNLRPPLLRRSSIWFTVNTVMIFLPFREVQGSEHLQTQVGPLRGHDRGGRPAPLSCGDSTAAGQEWATASTSRRRVQVRDRSRKAARASHQVWGP
jgi:transcriptional regulator with XRE-family HTH domain